MRLIGFLLVIFVAVWPGWAQPQPQGTVAPNSEIAVPPEGTGSNVSLEIENSEPAHCPTALAQRIFQETVREVTFQLNPMHPPAVQMKVTLRFGQKRDFVETLHGNTESTIISMKRWSDVGFARMMVRAVRSSLLNDDQLDRYAKSALSRARARISVSELVSR